MKVLALTKYGSQAASTRQRFIQYEPALAEAEISVDYAPFFPNDHLERLIAGRGVSRMAALRGYLGRVRTLIAARSYDALWVHYEIFPFLPGAMERLGRWTGKPIVVDYDDATFHVYDASLNPVVRRLLGRKLVPLLRNASVACCGNIYLQDYAAKHCRKTIILPTVVDTDRYVPVTRNETKPIVIGWIGSPSTWKFVRPLLPLLRGLVNEFDLVIRAVGAGDAAQRDFFPGLELVEWHEEGEVSAVQGMDIGIMPVDDGPFERGKCGYKLIQYMACGLPVVASPVGVNRTIVDPGHNGYLARNDAEWREALVNLILNRDLRAKFGQKGRKRVVSDFSLARHAPRLVVLLKSVGKAGQP